MIETTVEVRGMMCGMCESHVNDAIRAALPVRKVTSSHAKGRTVIESDSPLDEQALRRAIEATGYEVGAITSGEKASGWRRMATELRPRTVRFSTPIVSM